MIRNIIFGILILASIGVIVLLDVPNVQGILALRKQIEVAKQNFSERQAFIGKVDSLIDVYQKNEENIDKLDQILPAKEDIPNLIVQVEALVFEQGLILDQLNVNSSAEDTGATVAEEVRTGQAAANAPKYKTLNIDLGFTGDYSAMKNFLKATEENMRLIDIDSISITPEAEVVGIFKYQLTLKTYYQ